jgi:hypothetical protein
MFRHRLAPEADYYRLPEAPPPEVGADVFVLCSAAVAAGCPVADMTVVQQMYAAAYQQALEANRPSIYERDLFFWN